MRKKAAVAAFCALLLMQACGPLAAQTPAPVPPPDAPGLLQRLRDRARDVQQKVYDIGGTAMALADAYYEEHIQPVTAGYTEWASNLKTSMWTRIKTTVDSYVS
ncbi:apolipoprotein C-IV [Betta splendens]|uniref:Apolipoprotein C-IV n=1 Tax=Betta splendens TaxID=158456 RepID=A0A8M1H5V1_BETSP|nr:apolipoprotein C-IV [Betta splendens]